MIEEIYFVGVHHKKGFEALDSRTLSGRIIDRVIKRLPEFKCKKVNLFPTEYMPDETAQQEYAYDFEYNPNAVYVLLGKVVQKYLGDLPNILLANHPAYAHRISYTDNYVNDLSKRLRLINGFNRVNMLDNKIILNNP